MKVFGRDITAAIFDLDGTLIDSTSMWSKVDELFFSRHGLSVPPDYGMKITHMGLRKAAEFTRHDYLPRLTEEEILAEWDELARLEYEENIPLKPCAKECLDYFSSKGIKLAVATANSPSLYRPCLKRLGIESYFSVFSDPTIFPGGKTSAEIYDHICEKLDTSPKNTIVVEDALLPMKIAREGGYLSLGVFDEKTTKDKNLAMASCEHFFESLSDLLNAVSRNNEK